MSDQLFTHRGSYTGQFFVTGLVKESGAFSVGIRKNNEVFDCGAFLEGISDEEKHVLKEIIMKNKKNSRGSIVKIEPGICCELTFQGSTEKGFLIEPVFKRFLTDIHWEDCTWGQLILSNLEIHKEVYMTNPNKPVWEEPFVNKERFITYLYEISPYMLPFLLNKILTVIRFPHGVNGETFYQKNIPNYAPDFVETVEEEDIHYIHCKDLSTLLWLGNQLALEFHVPFDKIGSDQPSEIVFDLDPPSIDFFPLAVKAAKEMEKLFRKFTVTSYPKLSGNKGLQVHIPVHHLSITYDDARIFTSFIAKYLVEKFPKEFTVERMKKNRGNKLYIDYLQHWHGKTIICPYSTRGKEGARVAAPLFWREVKETLCPANFTIFTAMKRIEKYGCPWDGYFERKNEAILPIIDSIKANSDE